MSVERIFIVANNPKIPVDEMNHKYTLTSADILVRCNHCAHVNTLFPEQPFVWAARSDSREFRTMKEKPRARVIEVIAWMGGHKSSASKLYSKLLKLVPDGAALTTLGELPRVPSSSRGNASTGFAAYKHFSDKYPGAHIHLIGWTFHDLDPRHKWHDFPAERRAILTAIEHGGVSIH